MAYIAYSTPKNNGAVYATVVESIREGDKVKQQRIENLGRVIDFKKGIFKNRKQGVFRYTLEDGFMDVGIPEPGSAAALPEQEKLILVTHSNGSISRERTPVAAGRWHLYEKNH